MIGLSVVEPTVLVGAPFVLLVALLPGRSGWAVLLAALALLPLAAGGREDGLWWAERGWALLLGGWFVALTLRFPRTRFLPRALGSVAGTSAVAALVFAVTPGAWALLDWLVGDRMRASLSRALEAMRALGGEADPVTPELAETLRQTVEAQAAVFPALLALASVAALAVAWWAWVRLTRGTSPLASVREFRFNDQLVWLFLAGLALLVMSGAEEGWGRAGSNAVLFMGALYALRGAAVVIFFNGGVGLFGVVFLLFGLLFLAPVLLVGALVIGLGDTWLDLRERTRRAAG